MTILAALTALAAVPAAAARHAAPARQTVMTAPRPAGDPIMAIVSIKSQHVTFYDTDGWILRAPVSTGTTGRETPAGVFAVIEKDKDHHSTMYDDAWMPNMLRITWNGIALHGGPLPGYAASHGCVRMPFDFAEKVFDKAPMGMRVIISPTDSEPVAFSDPALFQPKQDAIDAIPARAAALSHDADEATQAAAAAKAAVMPAKRAAAMAPLTVRRLSDLKRRADAALTVAEKKLAGVNAIQSNPNYVITDQARADAVKAAAEDARQKAAAEAEALGAQRDAAKTDAKAKQDAAAAAVAAAKDAEAKRVAAVNAATAAKLASEPVAIYISRATQKLYVRRDTHKKWPDGGELYDFSQEYPVTIKDPDKPLGTHIFTAVARGRRRLALDRSLDRQRRQRQERARPHHLPASRARQDRTHRSAAVLDHHLGRAAVERNQLPHRIRRGAQQSAAGRLHHADAVAEHRNSARRRRLWLRLVRLRRLCAAAIRTVPPQPVLLLSAAVVVRAWAGVTCSVETWLDCGATFSLASGTRSLQYLFLLCSILNRTLTFCGRF